MAARVTYYATELTRTATTTTNYSVAKVTSSFLPTANKTYAILWSAVLDSDNRDYQQKVRIQRTDSVPSSVTLAEEIMDPRWATPATVSTSAGGLALYTAPASPVSQTLQMQVASSNVVATVGIQEARLFIIELIDGVDIWASSVAEETTTSSPYVPKVTLSWTPATAGDYYTLASAEVQAGAVEVSTRLFVDAATVAGENPVIHYNHAANWQMYVAGYRHIGISGAHTASLEWSSWSGGAAPIRNAYAVSFRLSEFESAFWAEDRTERSSTSATYVDSASVTDTPAAVRYLMVGCGRVSSTGGTETSTANRLAVGGVGQGTVYPQQTAAPFGYSRNWFDIAVRTETASSTTWSTQYARTAGINTAVSDEHVLAVLQIDTAAAPAVGNITYIGAGASAHGDYNVAANPPLPGGITAGDLLVCFTHLRSNGTIASSWTTHVSNDASATFLRVSYKIATGADTAPTITPSGASTGQHHTSAILAFRGVDVAAPFGTPGLMQQYASAEDIGPISAATATAADGAVIVFAARNDAVGGSLSNAPTLTGDGLTWVQLVDDGSVDNFSHVIINYATWEGAAPTLTAKTFDMPGGTTAAVSAGVMLLLNPSVVPLAYVGVGASASGDHTTALAPPIPAGVVAGDILLAVAYLHNAGTLSISTGWTEHYILDTTENGSDFYLRVWYRFATGSDTAPTISISGGVTAPQSVTLSFVVAYRGVHPNTPFGTHGVDSFNASLTNIGPIAASAAPLDAGAALVLGIQNVNAGATINAYPAVLPVNLQVADATALSLGTRWFSDVAGQVTGVRFYKGGTTGGDTHTVALYADDGTQLAVQVSSGETSSGWQTVLFASPVNVSANTAYKAVTHWPLGYRPQTDSQFLTQYDSAPLHIYANGGQYVGSASIANPTNVWSGAGYFSDVLFRTTGVWSSVDTLTGDGLSWLEDFDNYTNTVNGAGISLVMDHAIWGGGAPSLTAKTYVPVGGAAGPGMGKMFILNAASTTPSVTQTTQLSANAVVAIPVTTAISADVYVYSSTSNIILGTLTTADHITDMVPALPAGVAAGDILIAFGYLRGSGTLSISSGWTQHSLADLPQEIYLQTWFTIYDGSQVAPTISTTGGLASPQTLSMSFIIAARGYNTASPFGTDGADSVNVTQATIGPIAVPTSLPSSGTLLVTGWRNGTPWTSVPTLTGDGLTWIELFDNYTHVVSGRDITGVIDYATWSGGAPALTAKTFAPVGGASAPALGKMFVLNAMLASTHSATTNADAGVQTSRITEISADTVVIVVTQSTSVSADVSVMLPGAFAAGLSADAAVRASPVSTVSADANVSLIGVGNASVSAGVAVRVSPTRTVSADANVETASKTATVSADVSVINTATQSLALSADASVVIGLRTISQLVFCDTIVIPPLSGEGVLSAVGELSAERTDTAWLVLLTLSHAELPDPIRVTSDGVPTVSAGNVFSPFPFEIVLPDDVEGRPPQSQLTIDNTTQEIIAMLRGLTSPPKLTVQIVRSVNTDIVEYQWVGLEWGSSNYDKSTITGTLTFQDITREEFPYETFDGRWEGLNSG